KKLWATWRALIWARAIENLAIVVTTQNLFDHSERGLAMVAGPEEILFESTIAGSSVVEVGLERVRYLRSTRDAVGALEHCAVNRGLLGPQWRRPEFYDKIYRGGGRGAAKYRSDGSRPHGTDAKARTAGRRPGLSRPAVRCDRGRPRRRLRYRADA